MDTNKHLKGPYQLYINGEWRDSASGHTFDSINPATEEVIAQVAKGTGQDAEDAVNAAYSSFEKGTWAEMDKRDRERILLKAADLIETKYAEELAVRESCDAGKLLRDVRSVDVPDIANTLRYFAGWITKFDGAVKTPDGYFNNHLLGYTRREPLGVVVGITPYNFPLILSMTKIAPALAMGNSFIHKPASSTPLSANTLAKVFEEAGVPPGVYNLVTGSGRDVGTVFSTHSKVDKIALTGSTQTGIQISKDAADSMKHLTMELGGKAPLVIFDDSDLDVAVQYAVMGAFWNKGEVCVAATRIIVQNTIYEAFLEKFVEATCQLKVGDPLDPTTDMGPMAGRGEYEKVLKYIDIGKNEDKAQLAYGGEPIKVNGKGFYVSPTIFSHATADMRIANEEIFGPVVPVIPFDDFDEALEIANGVPFGLAAGVQTGDSAKAVRFGEKLKAGIIWLNTWHEYDVNMPFGGYKMSGYGRERGIETLSAYTQVKSMWLKLGDK